MKIAGGLLFLFAAFLAASSIHAQQRGLPLQNIDNAPVQSIDGKPMTLEQVRKAVVAGAGYRQWVVSAAGSNTLRATHTRGRHTAVVDISYTAESYSIRYVDSIDLNYALLNNGPVIHSTYNRWIQNLKQSIDASLRTTSAGM